MKNLIVAIVFIFSMHLFAQTSEDQVSTVSVYGYVELPMKAVKFRSKMTISLQEASYTSADCYKTLEEMQVAYFKKLVENGIDPKNVTENRADYYLNGRRDKGTTYEFESTDGEKVMTFMGVTIAGAYTNGMEYQLEEDQSNYDRNLKETLKQIESNAQGLASGLGQEIGKVMKIDMSKGRTNQKWTTYKDDGFVTIYAIYSLK